MVKNKISSEIRISICQFLMYLQVLFQKKGQFMTLDKAYVRKLQAMFFDAKDQVYNWFSYLFNLNPV